MPGDDERLARRYERERAARKEAEAIAERVTGELYAATGELQTANQAIRDFVAIASHDLKSPLTTVIGSASLLRQRWADLSDAHRNELLAAIERQGSHLSHMVDDLLTLSKIESGALEPKAGAVALRQAIADAIEGFLDRAPVTVVVDDCLAAECDPEHLHRILTNFVGNALKYGSPPVEVECAPVNGWVEIRVRDHGDGVPEDFVPRLFGKFARAETARSEQEGSGLGLSIVRGLAEINGGATWYEPNAPRGSCFTVRLKLAAA